MEMSELYEMNIFYDPERHSPFRLTSIENSLINPMELNDQSLTKSGKILRRIGYRANGCSCQDLTCGCCLGINMDQFSFNREGNLGSKIWIPLCKLQSKFRMGFSIRSDLRYVIGFHVYWCYMSARGFRCLLFAQETICFSDWSMLLIDSPSNCPILFFSLFANLKIHLLRISCEHQQDPDF